MSDASENTTEVKPEVITEEQLRNEFAELNTEHAKKCEKEGISVSHYFHPQWILDHYPEPEDWKPALEEFVALPHVTTTMLTDYLADFAWCARSKRYQLSPSSPLRSLTPNQQIACVLPTCILP